MDFSMPMPSDASGVEMALDVVSVGFIMYSPDRIIDRDIVIDIILFMYDFLIYILLDLCFRLFFYLSFSANDYAFSDAEAFSAFGCFGVFFHLFIFDYQFFEFFTVGECFVADLFYVFAEDGFFEF